MPEEKIPIPGAHDPEAYDKKHGRWWLDRNDKRRPVRYTQIGKHNRAPGLHRSLLYQWQRHTRNWLNLVREQHRKRWPMYAQLCVGFFSEFCLRRWTRQNLFEVAHVLPGYGVGCKFWKPTVSKGPKNGGGFFVVNSIDFQVRPFSGKVVGDQFFTPEKLLKTDIQPMGKTTGGWNYVYPEERNYFLYRPSFPPTKKNWETKKEK